MKIAYIAQDPYNKNSWSGTNYYLRKALEDLGHEVYCLSELRPRESLFHIVLNYMLRIFGRSYFLGRSLYASKKYAEYIQRNLAPDTDAIVSLGTMYVACLEVNIPIFLVVDGVFEQMRYFYKTYHSIKKGFTDANIVEQKALEKATKVFPCSDVTANAISKYYRILPSKIVTIPLGANLDKTPSKEYVHKRVSLREKNRCKLLFVGVDWYRKGADIVFEATKLLHDRGFNVELHICGLKKVPIVLPDYVHNHGFLNKNRETDFKELEELYYDSHFLFVPSRAEAYGLVFCEAGAYGLPSISHSEGGLLTTIKDDVNGHLFSIGTKPEVFADYIYRTFSNYDKYLALCRSSRGRYDDALNWSVAGKKYECEIQKAINNA